MGTLNKMKHEYNIWYEAKSKNKGKLIDILIGKKNENKHDHIVFDDWKLVCDRCNVCKCLSEEELKKVNQILKIIFYNLSFNS